MKLSINVVGDGITIVDATDDFLLWEIGIQDLPKKSNNETSLWITNLMDKIWIDVGTLYQLAKIINTRFPKNTIDWRETFFLVEMKSYVKTFGEVLIPKKESAAEEVSEEVKFRMKENNDETIGIVDEIVTKRLIEFGLITNNSEKY